MAGGRGGVRGMRGVHGGGHVWWGACMAGGHACHACTTPPHNEIQLVNVWVECILLECILVLFKCGLSDIRLCKYCNFLTTPEV